MLTRVNAVAQGAAMMTGTTGNDQVVSAYADVVQNRTLDQLAFKHISEVYPIKYTDEELEYAKAFHDIGNKEECLMYQEMAKRLYGEKGENLFKGAVDILNEPEIVLQAKIDLEKALDGKVYQSIIPIETKAGMIE